MKGGVFTLRNNRLQRDSYLPTLKVSTQDLLGEISVCSGSNMPRKGTILGMEGAICLFFIGTLIGQTLDCIWIRKWIVFDDRTPTRTSLTGTAGQFSAEVQLSKCFCRMRHCQLQAPNSCRTRANIASAGLQIARFLFGQNEPWKKLVKQKAKGPDAGS